MSSCNEPDLFESSISDDCGPRVSWVGLLVNHRRLFDALQDGWLRPLPPHKGVLVRVEAYAHEREESLANHPIHVGIKLDVKKLPDLDVHILYGKEWESSRLSEIEPTEKVVYWPGVLPTFAISELTVSTKEERVRLEGLAQQVSNVDFSSTSISVGAGCEQNIESDISHPKKTKEFAVPSGVDAIHGAMSMAVRAVPAIDPWMDILTASLAPGRTKQLDSAVAEVKANWWRFPPWQEQSLKGTHQLNLQESFWLAAIEVFRKQSIEKYVRPQELAEQIADVVLRRKRSKDLKKEISEWLKDTDSLLRAESVMQLKDWRDHPVWMMIQMVLTRSEPVRFNTWFKEMPDMPPAVGWSAAVLCGLLCGYKRLDKQFRGDAIQRELLSIHALRMYSSETSDMKWPLYDAEKIQWRRDSDFFVLSWGDKEFKQRRVKERGAWYVANYEDAEIESQAQSVAEKLDWPCIHRRICFKDSKFSLSGAGTIKVLGKSDRQLDVQGEVCIQLPKDFPIEKTLDVERFRQLVAEESGLLDSPPTPKILDTRDEHPQVAGLKYIPDFINEREEKDILNEIEKVEWSKELKRRVQHYGWKYNYRDREINESMRIGELPPWANKIAQKLHSEGLVKEIPDQVIVNEYKGEQGIGKHTDSSRFADDIATISLLESWKMWFREKHETTSKVEWVLEQRSVAIMSGEVRYNWTHEIPKRKKEAGKERKRRISLTFRKVMVPMKDRHEHESE